MNLSSFLKQYRRNNCLSQGDIARITGLDRTTISKIFPGHRIWPGNIFALKRLDIPKHFLEGGALPV